MTDSQSLNTIITREFKSKMPNHIKKSVSFKACTDTDISIAKMAETVQECQSGQVESNYFQKSKNGSGKGRWFRPKFFLCRALVKSLIEGEV